MAGAIWELWNSIDFMEDIVGSLVGFDRYYDWFTEVSEPEQFLILRSPKEVYNALVCQLEIYETLYPESKDYLLSSPVLISEGLLYPQPFQFKSFLATLLDFQAFYLNLILTNVDAWGSPREASVNIPLRFILLWCKLFIASIFTIWARGVGPRARPDQLSDMTWKDFLLNLLGFLIIVIYYLMLG